MAKLTLTPTISITANGTTTASGTITWNASALPDDAIVSSVVVSGSYTWGGKGNFTITINGTNIGSSFNVELGANATSPYTITGKGNNKNASGNNCSWSNLQLVITYTTLSEGTNLRIKENGSWTGIYSIYKKVNGSWVLQENSETIFDENTKYIRKN